METDPETERRAYARSHPKHWIGINAEDIPTGWMDDMVKRLFEELNRQIAAAENASIKRAEKKDGNGNIIDEPDARERNARILSRLQNQLERLTRMEMDRAALRKSRPARSRKSNRESIQQKVLATTAAGSGQGDPGESR